MGKNRGGKEAKGPAQPRAPGGKRERSAGGGKAAAAAAARPIGPRALAAAAAALLAALLAAAAAPSLAPALLRVAARWGLRSDDSLLFEPMAVKGGVTYGPSFGLYPRGCRWREVTHQDNAKKARAGPARLAPRAARPAGVAAPRGPPQGRGARPCL
jgi:hypothetical protein